VDILIGVVIGDGDDHMGQVERGGIFRDRVNDAAIGET
jgi:hypothetical protein